MKYISVLEYLDNQIKVEELTTEQLANVNTLIPRINRMCDELKVLPTMTSGYRSPEHNKTVGGKAKSKHMLCAAIDLADVGGELKKILNIGMLKEYDLYMEHPSATPTWCHLQCIPPKSGNRIFYP